MSSQAARHPLWAMFQYYAGNLRLSFLLLACIVLGGTSQYIYTFKLPLYLISLLFIGGILASNNRRDLSKLITLPNLLISSFAALFILYCLPVWPSLWSGLAGRNLSVEGFTLLQEPLPWLPLSLHPEKTFLSIFDFLPILAVMMVTGLTKNNTELLWALYALLVIVFISFLFGLFQMVLGPEGNRLYAIYNPGRPLGFFSNTNHFACLCAMVLPVAFYLALKNIGSSSQSGSYAVQRFLGGMMIIAFSTAIILSGSGAGYLMLLIAFIVSPLIIINNKRVVKRMRILILCGIVLLVADFVFFSGQFWKVADNFTSDISTSRSEIFKTITGFRKDYGLFGIGPGAFEHIYKIYESQSPISTSFVNQAHNDYVQLWLEFGVFGALAVIIGMVGFVRLAYKQIVSRERYTIIYLLAAFMPIFHSSVDYPFRTIAISATFVFILSLISRKVSF